MGEKKIKIIKGDHINWLKFVLVIVMMSLLFSGCNKMNEKSGGNQSKSEIVVFAAASLTECFGKIKEEYESDHENVEIILNFAGSQVLKNQIEEGADPAMYFSANLVYPQALIEGNISISDKLLSEEDIDIFAKNKLLIISSEDDIKDLDQFIDRIKNGESSIVLAHDEVPVGKYTMNMIEMVRELQEDQVFYDRFYDQVVSYENDVKAVLAKIKMKEADFGIVYGTDAMTVNDSLYLIEIDQAYNQIAVYGSLLLSEGESEEAFYEYVTQGYGQEILREFGFVTD